MACPCLRLSRRPDSGVSPFGCYAGATGPARRQPDATGRPAPIAVSLADRPPSRPLPCRQPGDAAEGSIRPPSKPVSTLHRRVPAAFKTRLHPAPAHPARLQNPSPPRSGASRPPSKPVSTPLRRIPSHLTSHKDTKTDLLPIKLSVEP
ncbi:hypothetical protein VPH35_011197 [Triticum aestivum]